VKKFLNKILSFILLLTGALPFLFTLHFLGKQQLIRHEMKEKMEREMLHTVIIPENELVWVKYKKEVRINDKMFDVETYRIDNGQYYLTGLFDEEETALNNYFEKSTDQKNEKGSQMLSALLQFLQSMYPGDPDEPLDFKNISKAYRPLILQHISFPFKNVLTPPPQA
jgi:hypothetical protein